MHTLIVERTGTKSIYIVYVLLRYLFHDQGAEHVIGWFVHERVSEANERVYIVDAHEIRENLGKCRRR